MKRASAALRSPVRILWTVAGTVFLAVGVAGVILPLLPGTVFLLIASLCYLRGSERLHRWLVNHPVLGHHIKVMTGETPMPLGSKITAIAAMWIAVTISIFAARHGIVQIALAALAVYGTVFIVRRR
jgi:uncharacterized protein